MTRATADNNSHPHHSATPSVLTTGVSFDNDAKAMECLCHISDLERLQSLKGRPQEGNTRYCHDDLECKGRQICEHNVCVAATTVLAASMSVRARHPSKVSSSFFDSASIPVICGQPPVQTVCGNGQTCIVGTTGVCVDVDEETPCGSEAASADETCGKNQMCIAGKCVALFGSAALGNLLRKMQAAFEAERDR